MATLTAFEHERIEFDWNGRHLRAVERLNRALGTTVLQATTHRGRRVLKAGHYVGVVRFGRDTIQILPKIDYGHDETGSATRNLLYLLEAAGNFPVRRHDIATLADRGQDWFEILTRLFATELQVQWQRGPHRHYQVVEEVLPTLKGKWRISQQLRQPARQHRFDVAYDEFTVDNPLNRVLRLVVERLWQQTGDHENRRLLGELRQWLDGVALRPHLTQADASDSLITRLNRRYQPLLNLARLFLGGSAIEMTTGDTATFALIFDMNRLFEAFLVNLLRRYRHQILPPTLHHCTLHPQTRGHTRYLAQAATGPVFRLKPDLAIRDGDRFPLLLDVKYKRLKARDRRLGIAQSDFYQMFAYAQRYRCAQVLLLYPQTDEAHTAHFKLAGETAVTVTAVTVNLHRDLGSPVERQALKDELGTAFTLEKEP